MMKKPVFANPIDANIINYYKTGDLLAVKIYFTQADELFYNKKTSSGK